MVCSRDTLICLYMGMCEVGLQVRSLLLQQIIDGVGNRVGQVITLDLCLSSCRVGPPDVKWGSFPMLTA